MLLRAKPAREGLLISISPFQKIAFIGCLFGMAFTARSQAYLNDSILDMPRPEPVSEGKVYAWDVLGTLVPVASGLIVCSSAHHFKSPVGNRLIGAGMAFSPSLGE